MTAMRLLRALTMVACLFTMPSVASAAGDPVSAPTPAQVRGAIERSLAPIIDGGVAWMNDMKCVSCHRTAVMSWALTEARRQRFDVDGAQLDTWTAWSVAKSVPKDAESDEVSNLDGITRLILGRDRSATRPTDASAQFTRAMVAAQRPDGSWSAGGQLPGQKRPKDETDQTTTMWIALALGDVAADDTDARRARRRAIASLTSARPAASTEWYAVRLLLAAQDGDPGAVRRHAAALRAHQRADGGWGWLVDDESDALATGLAVFALSSADLDRSAPPLARALRFLVDTQREDGTWPVRSTMEAHRHEEAETAVYWGTAWAALGMLRAIDG